MVDGKVKLDEPLLEYSDWSDGVADALLFIEDESGIVDDNLSLSFRYSEKKVEKRLRPYFTRHS
jgi:hypothetical protein